MEYEDIPGNLSGGAFHQEIDARFRELYGVLEVLHCQLKLDEPLSPYQDIPVGLNGVGFRQAVNERFAYMYREVGAVREVAKR